MSVVRHLAVPAALAAVFVWAPAAQANHSYPATYTGTHQAGGGAVEFDVNADGTAITRISISNVPGNACVFAQNEPSVTTGNIPINNHAFSTGGPSSTLQFSGSFQAPQMAQGTLRLRAIDGSCDSGQVPWTASTSVPPPGAPPPGPAPGPTPGADTTPPTVGVSAPRSQRLGRGRIRIRVSCPAEACEAVARGTLSFPGAAATFRLRGATVSISRGDSETAVLRVPRRALAAAKRALARGRRVTARISVTAVDAAGNERAPVRRTVRLRR